MITNEMKKLRTWVISDTHNNHMFLEIPDNIDMVIHSGDFGSTRQPAINANEAKNFLEWYDSLVHIKYKVLIAGNHDTSIEAGLVKREDIPKSIAYLEHEHTVIEGLKIFGSPYTASFGQGWAFNVARHKLDQYWESIEQDTDIIITHGMPKGILDLAHYDMQFTGCKALLNKIKQVNPKLCIGGHIHEDGGKTQTILGLQTIFINASVLDLSYKLVNNGHIIEIETKS